MTLALRLNSYAFLALMIWFLRLRYRLARLRQQAETLEPPAAQPVQVTS